MKLFPLPRSALSPLLRATALEVAVFFGHLLLYPSGIRPEPTTGPTGSAVPTGPTGAVGAVGPTGPAGYTATAGPTTATAPTAPTATTGPTAATGSATATALPSAGGFLPPVVLLHGFADNRSVFVLLRRSLARHGWCHLTSLNYSPLTCDIRTAAGLLGRHVEEICARTGHREVDIIGHSLGGLIARYYTQRLGGDTRVRTLVTLGTPHEGTRVAPPMSAHPLVRQMRPGSSLIEELARPAPGCRTRFVSFWSDLDQLMLPVETARIHHPDLIAQNVQVSGIGHLALPVHPAVAAGIRQVLQTPEQTAATTGSSSVA
ncbi:esterase/lipase family protein [Streptomyces sp. NPDC058657]|uniref:esterase/lipase family protein n=1 Tax=unclassified Streptomyces TaxID=2593676 RepID=UPI00364E02DB